MDTRRLGAGRMTQTHFDLSIVAIIPLYNGARWIEQSIKSVLAQTLTPDEFIVVDDGSTDDGPQIVERLAQSHPITLLRKPNGGQSSARNFGVAHSKSALIALLDEIDESGGVVNKRVLHLLSGENPKRSLAGCLSRDMFILPSASLISRGAFEAVGGFDERLCGYEDDDLFLRLFRAGYDNIFIDEPLSKWRIYQTSTSYTSRMARSRIIYAIKLFEQFPNNRAQRRYWCRDCLAPRFLSPTLGDYVRALERRDVEMFRTAVAH